jgi:hypothetical protein
MPGLTCSSSGQGTFELVIDSTTYECVADTAPILLVENGGLTGAEFAELWPLLLVMLVTAWGLNVVIRQFMPR